jgi:PAS domain S-box-containing protein
VVFIADISDRRRAAEQLAAAERRFRQLIELNPDGVAVLRNEIVLYANPALLRMLGARDLVELTSVPLEWYSMPYERRTADERRARLLEPGAPPASLERGLRRLDGSHVLVETKPMVLDDFEGSPAVLALTRDVSERRALEERILQQDRLATVGTLATGVAHELEAPLAALGRDLAGALAHLPEGDDPERLAELRQRLADAEDGVRRVAAITGDLLALSSTDDTPAPMDVRRALEGALKLVRADLGRRARLELALDELPPVEGNAARLSQVFLNLMINATQALPARPLEENLVRVTARVDGDQVQIEVRDNGPGIPEGILSRIFEPFFTTKPTGVGTGLGLAVSRTLVDAMGGRLEARNLAEGGAAFVVILPVARPESL